MSPTPHPSTVRDARAPARPPRRTTSPTRVADGSAPLYHRLNAACRDAEDGCPALDSARRTAGGADRGLVHRRRGSSRRLPLHRRRPDRPAPEPDRAGARAGLDSARICGRDRLSLLRRSRRRRGRRALDRRRRPDQICCESGRQLLYGGARTASGHRRRARRRPPAAVARTHITSSGSTPASRRSTSFTTRGRRTSRPTRPGRSAGRRAPRSRSSRCSSRPC